MSTHTMKAFDADLEELSRMVAEMGGLAEKEIADSVMALVRRDVELAQKVIALDPSVDNLQRAIEEKAILTIARRQPMAVDLRDIVGSLRVSNDLERDHFLCQLDVAACERHDRVGDLLLGEAAHLGDHAGEFSQVGVKGPDGMFGHCLVLSFLPA
jgi:phosphate uptake regulator